MQNPSTLNDQTQTQAQPNSSVGENNSALGYGDATTGEDHYWRESYKNTAYYNQDYDYDRDYHAAYAVGYQSRSNYDANTRFEDVESDLEKTWNSSKGESKLSWSDARQAANDAWNRVPPTNG